MAIRDYTNLPQPALTTGYVQTVPYTTPISNGFDWTLYSTTPTISYCSGNIHVFGCDHAEKCLCGKSVREVLCTKCKK
jgi:hypothetical protein